MKNIFFAVAVMLCATACQRAMVPAANIIVNTEITNANGQVILAGKATPSSMQLPNHKSWYDQSYNSYTIDSASTRRLKPLVKNKTMEIFLGSWCGDSRREVPRMLKILQYAGVDTNNLSIVFVDNSPNRYKQSPQHEEQGKNIHRVPTFIVYDGKKEMGRIVELPVVSLEKDLLAILQQTTYEPNYKAVSWWLKNVPSKDVDMAETVLTELVPQVKPLVRSTAEFNSFAYVLWAVGNYISSINVFRLNTLIYPDNINLHNNLVDALTQSNRKKEAGTVLEKMLTLWPSDENVKKKIAELKM